MTQALGRFLTYLIAFICGAMVVTGLTLRLWWGNWGQGGPAALFVVGLVVTVITLFMTVFWDEL